MDKTYVLLYNLLCWYAMMIKVSNLLPVAGLIATLVYGWSLFRFFWILPSWLQFLTAGEILNILFLTFTISFVDSLVVLALLVMIAILTPSNWLRDDFVFRGSVMALFILIFAMYLSTNAVSLDRLPYFFAGFLIGSVVLQWLSGRILPARSLIAMLADRSIVFLYVYVPLSLVGIAGIFMRAAW